MKDAKISFVIYDLRQINKQTASLITVSISVTFGL
jgi:hypothetical protein